MSSVQAHMRDGAGSRSPGWVPRHRHKERTELGSELNTGNIYYLYFDSSRGADGL